MGKENDNREDKINLVVACECGAEIVVVSDLDEIERRIETHAASHEKSEMSYEKAEAEHCRIEELLTKKVLSLIGKNIQ